MGKPCSAIPAYTSKLMCCVATNKREKVVTLHHMQRNSLVTCEKHMKTLLGVLSCSDIRDKGFLLKTYLEDHKPRVDSSASACLSRL